MTQPLTFITGETQIGDATIPGLVTIEVIRALARGDQIATGERGGVEAIVRSLLDSAGVVRLSGRALVFQESCSVVAVFTDPLSSLEARSLVEVIPESRFTLVTPVETF